MPQFPDHVTTRLASTPEQMEAAVVGRRPVNRSHIEVIDHDPRWAEQFVEIHDSLSSALGSVALSIEHVGSTSVLGLPAKPIIDVDVIVPDAEVEDDYVPALYGLGLWMLVREPWWHGHRLFVEESGAMNVHVWPDGAAEPIRHRLFRNWLRSHDDDRDAYASVKRTLARDFRDDPEGYNLAKCDVIDQILARAFAAGQDPPTA